MRTSGSPISPTLRGRTPGRQEPGRLRRAVLLQVGWALLVLSTVPWRRDVLFEGGIDAVVAGKAAVALLALGAAAAAARTSRRTADGPAPIPVLLLAAVVLISLVGAAGAGHLSVACVVAARLVLVGASVVLLLRCEPAEAALGRVLVIFAATAAVAALSGAVALVGEPGRTRLQGGFPAFEPNELAALLLPTALGAAAAILAGQGRRLMPLVALILAAAGIVWTGSRTALALMLLGLAVLLLAPGRRPRVPRKALLLALAVVAAIVVVLAASGALTDLLLRGQGAGRLLTLNSRTIAWQQAFTTAPGSWAWWAGRGLDVKDIAVHGQYWSRQVFDSSWVSAFVQTGVVGLLLTVVYAAGTLVGAARRLRSQPLWIVLALVGVLRGLLENGLVEASTTFILFFVVACACWPARGSRTVESRAT